MFRRQTALCLTLPALLLAGDAGAVRKPDYLHERPLEVADGVAARPIRHTQHRPTATGAAAWKAFTAQHGQWTGLWDEQTGVPARVWGEGIAVPGASADARVAEAVARRLLREQLAFLAPGTKLEHWQLAANLVHGRGDALRTVSFTQTVDGVPVLGGGVSFLIKRDRVIVLGSSARPGATVTMPARLVDGDAATAAARAWIARAYGATPVVRSLGALIVLPLVRDPVDGAPAIEYRTARVIELDLARPRARWDVYVDAATGAPIARRQTLSFATGTLQYDTPVRHPAGARQSFPAARAAITVGGSPTTTDDAGAYSAGAAGTVTVNATVTGPRVRVTNDGAIGATSPLSIADGGTGTWSAPSNELVDAQLTGFIHANRMKSFSLTELNPQLGWLTQQMDVSVNEGGDCNAYSDGDAIHFLVSGGGCENTGRLPDVVYHEFGHSLHHQSVIPGVGDFDSAMSEGISDYLAATTTDDPGMGRGFFAGTDTALRHVDPAGGEYYWPTDISADPHVTGLIIAGALWDVRKAMIAQYGAVEGKRKADDLFYATLRRADDIPTTYPEVLAADDDDGNLANGTPNQCLIDAAFGPHGLVDGSSTFGIGRPTRDGNTIAIAVTAIGTCAAPVLGNVALVWRVAGGNDTAVAMTANGGTFSAVIPTQPDGSVVEYRLVATMGGGAMLRFPDNPAERYYQYYVGPLTPVYCTDFETDPFAAGWTHSATSSSDDWQWGTAAGNVSNGDPDRAASGTSFVGTDLRANGLYSRNSIETLSSPTIDVRGYTGLRVQYKRWLTIEDGFFDEATVLADGEPVWRNFASGDEEGHTHTLDREWREVDLDVDAQALDGSLKIDFRLGSDQGLEFGGWNLDDFCVMAQGTGPVQAVCGNGRVETGEACDDSNVAPDDGCSATCQLETDPPPDEGGCCSTGSDPRGALVLGVAAAAILVRRRRRQA